MAEQTLPHIKRNSNDKKHRIFEVIQSIKDAILKRKYNQAWDHAAKYYEQNKSSLKNQEIYRLCWLSCQSINKKVNIRLTASPKSYLPLLTDNHLNHLYSLYLSLHLMILPEVTNKDRKYFDMLTTSETLINPKSISPHDLVFQRKPSSFFLQKDQINKQLKKLVKQHLRIVNNTLMYKVKTRKSHQDVVEVINYAQEIFDSFKEHDFPVEFVNFQLIKLSLMEDLGIKQGIKCEYRLPIELINKIYSHLRIKKDQALQHYIKKLSSYLVLSFRNLPMKIQDIYIICQQILFLTKILHEISAPPSLLTSQPKKKFPLLKLNRQITIQKDPVEEEIMSKSGKNKISSGFSTNKLSQKKLESKTRLHRPEGQLKNIALIALEKINLHLAGRKEVNHIILSYFPQQFFRNLKNDPSDQIIDSQVPLQISRKNRKNGIFQQRTQEDGQQKCKRKNYRSLTSLINRKGFQKKIQTYEQSEKQTVLTNTMSKKKAKFIARNIQMIKKDNEIDAQMSRKLQKVINSLGGEVEFIDESSSDEQGNMNRAFERERRQEIKNANCKYQNNKKPNSTTNKDQKLANQKNNDEDSASQGLNDQERVRSISLLDDVVNSVVNDLLEMPNSTSNNNKHSKKSIAQKLQMLKCEVENLNLQRDLLVDRLTKRKNIDIVNMNDREQSESQNVIKQDKFISDLYEKTKQKMAQHIALNTKLINLQKQNKYKVTSQPKIRLKLDKQYKKMPEITYASLQEQYRRLQGCIQSQKEVWDMVLSCQYDKLRRDVAKNQFASQNQKKNANKKGKCETIIQNTLEEDNN